MEKSRFESLEQMADSTAAGLAQAAAASAFSLFRDQQFRRVAGFERLSETEQDRTFNEVVVAYLVLIMLLLEAPDLRVAEEFRSYLRGLQKKIPKAYVEYLREQGVEPRYLPDWEKLITMRYDEFGRDRHDVRAAAMEIESSEKSLTLDSLSNIQMLVPVQAVAIGCHQHIYRGVTDGRDELFKLILEALSKFYVDFRVRIEGRKRSPLTKTRAAVKRMFRRKHKKRK